MLMSMYKIETFIYTINKKWYIIVYEDKFKFDEFYSLFFLGKHIK